LTYTEREWEDREGEGRYGNILSLSIAIKAFILTLSLKVEVKL